jgi:riboflavin synthase
MFTGIIEQQARVVAIVKDQSNVHFQLTAPFQHELKVDQSVSHNGVCLTVTKIEETGYWVTAIDETLQRTNLSQWNMGDAVNVERCMPAHGRFDGHIVQGHVDCTGIIDEIHDLDGSWMNFITHDADAGITVNKGSICVNGVSLTVVDSFPDAFSVAIIPYTWEHTNLSVLKPGDLVNLEFDILGKYLKKFSVSLQISKK